MLRRIVSSWTVVVPAIAVLALILSWDAKPPLPVLVLIGIVLIGAILAAVHHAEIIASKVGEPFGSLVLAVAVTVIEVGLIVTLMVSGDSDASTLARDTVFAAVMICLNAIVGLSLLMAATKHELPRFNREGAGAALAVVATLATLTLVVPTFTTSADDSRFTPAQLAFVGVASLVLYVAFVATQTRAHRDFFLPVAADGSAIDGEAHADPPTTRGALLSLGLLVVSLVSVVGLAKAVSPGIEAGVAAAGIPNSFVGVVIALLVLMPEGLAATRAALRNRLQTSLNLGIGSAIASIGLTIPVIAVATIWLPVPLTLGLGSTQIVLLILTLLVTILSIVPGRTTRLQGVVHLAIFAAFIVLAIQP